MPVHTEAAHTQEVVISGPRPPVSAACKINVIGPAKEMTTAMKPAFHAVKDESLQEFLNRCFNQGPHIRQNSSGMAQRFK